MDGWMAEHVFWLLACDRNARPSTMIVLLNRSSSSNKHINWNDWKERFIIGHLHNTEVLCSLFFAHQYRELIKAGDRPTAQPSSTFCLLSSISNPIPSNPWLQLQHLVRQHLLGHLRGSFSGGARGGIFNFKWWRVRHRDHLPPRWGWAPSHRRNTVSCFPSIGLTIKHEIESNR